MRTGLIGIPTGKPLQAWQPTEGTGKGPMLWEKYSSEEYLGIVPCKYRKRLAEIGIVQWADVTANSTGAWLTWNQARERYGARLQGKADRRDLFAMIDELSNASNALHVRRWQGYVAAQGLGNLVAGPGTVGMGQGTRCGSDRWIYDTVLGARRAPNCFGSWEYRV